MIMAQRMPHVCCVRVHSGCAKSNVLCCQGVDMTAAQSGVALLVLSMPFYRIIVEA